MNLWFSLSGNKAKGRMKGLQRFSEAYTFIALLKGSRLWSINNLTGALHSDQTGQDKRHLGLTSPEPTDQDDKEDKRNVRLKMHQVLALQSQIFFFSNGKHLVNCFDFVQKVTGGFLLFLLFLHLNYRDSIHWIMKV